MNWNNYDKSDFEELGLDETELSDVEQFAEYHGLPYKSERELADTFRAEILPFIVEAYSADDQPAISEGFSNWSDSVCKDGDLHPLQYHNYCFD